LESERPDRSSAVGEAGPGRAEANEELVRSGCDDRVADARPEEVEALRERVDIGAPTGVPLSYRAGTLVPTRPFRGLDAAFDRIIGIDYSRRRYGRAARTDG
jgi:hypothetical protein